MLSKKPRWRWALAFTFSLLVLCTSWLALPGPTAEVVRVARNAMHRRQLQSSEREGSAERDAFVKSLIARMTKEELIMQLHMTFGNSASGPNSKNELFEEATRYGPIGVVHDWYPTNAPPPHPNYYNELQALNLNHSRLPIPFIQFGECLHGVGSYKQSMFPAPIGLAASWDQNMVKSVGRAIGAEARSLGVHACLAPVLDLGKEVRWGRTQEGWGEDYVLTSHMGVAFSRGLSKDGQWHEPDAVVPVIKHFIGHGSGVGGINAAPYHGAGLREHLMEFFRPFKAAIQHGGAKGVMMAYHEYDGIPAHVNPFFYDALEEWGYDGFVMADDTGMLMLQTRHTVSSSPADTLSQWFNTGGEIQFYDFHLDVFMNTTLSLIANNSVSLSTVKKRVTGVLNTKYDLGLFRTQKGGAPSPSNPPNTTSLYVPSEIHHENLTSENAPLTLEAAQKSIVLLENRAWPGDASMKTLPLRPQEQGLKRIALIGPFGDIMNYGDYSGTWGASPVPYPENAVGRAGTIREGLLGYLNGTGVQLVTSVGANTWMYNAQYAIPAYLLSPPSNSSGAVRSQGLLGTYYASPKFTDPRFSRVETPNKDWGLFPPYGLADDGETTTVLPNNNFSAVWEGELSVPVFVSDGTGDTAFVEGIIGVGVSANTSARLFLDGTEITSSSYPPFDSATFRTGTILGNIQRLPYSIQNATIIPPGGAKFRFKSGKKHQLRIEFQTWNLAVKIENVQSVNSQVQLWWNLVDQQPKEDGSALSVPVQKAVEIASNADVIVLAVGANWNSDGESGDRATLGLSPNQTELADAIFQLNKPVILVLQGGRPFAIRDYYRKCAAAINAFFPGQSGGQAIADVLFGSVNPGGRITLSVPYDSATLPVYYNFHFTAHARNYTDLYPYPYYTFGYGLSYTTFSVSNFKAASTKFASGETIAFNVDVKNTGGIAGSYVAQVYLLVRVSAIVRPLRQLVAFERVYLDAEEAKNVEMKLDVDDYLPIVNRRYEWELEKGDYTFALMENGGPDASSAVNVTLTCLG